MRTRMSGGVRGVRSNAAPISIIVILPLGDIRLGLFYSGSYYGGARNHQSDNYSDGSSIQFMNVGNVFY